MREAIPSKCVPKDSSVGALLARLANPLTAAREVGGPSRGMTSTRRVEMTVALIGLACLSVAVELAAGTTGFFAQK